MMQKEAELLKSPLTQLPLSENFCLRSKLMGLNSLDDIIRTPPAVLVKKEDFSYEWLGELSRFMKNTNLLHRLQPIPGSTAC
jgi:hypothetical protein